MNVQHVPTMSANLIFVALLNKAKVKVSFEFKKIILTKNNVFVIKDYCNQGLFVLNVCNVVNKKASTSAYMIESISLWHARLGHINFSYIKNMQLLGLISDLDSNNINKCEICAEAKTTKKSCFSVSRGNELLSLIDTDVGGFKTNND
ncbi:hypothetical protein RDI58_014487 [Solanum bulbocastanum]|uniref:GAG-pre-integrase domain-containing protein n=1 Tax=Solanum bulbocastanum TaxID=147425 RepID=A0AAN8TJ38_SOLBU